MKQRESGAELTGAQFRSLITNNLSLKIFALLLAVTMWGFVASQQRGESAELKFAAPLVLKNIPKELEVTSSIDESVSVLVRVRRDLAKTVNPSQFQISIDLRNQLPGSFEYSLTESNISYNNELLPDGVNVLQISPANIPLLLEPTYGKNVTIKPRFSGDLVKGFTIESIKIYPPLVAVRGPFSHIERLISIPTRPLDVQDLQSDVEMLVSLDLPQMIRLEAPDKAFFRAKITVSDNPTRVLFRDIPVVFKNAKFSYKSSISNLNVHLEGPRNVMESLRKQDITAVVDLAKYPPGDYRGLAPKIVLPDTVKVLEQWPILDLFVLKRKVDKIRNSGARKSISGNSKRQAGG
ncbi:MAG: hypothetical protein O7A69_05435 [SAR324 cluster bacterium]|nr:hypothetical protein [SAR324 cluster bacterium]